MASTISKNSRRGTKMDVLSCACGGEIKMRTIYEGRKLKHFAECMGCGKTARKPKMLMS